MKPNKDQAHQFALMLSAGMPSVEALPYFFPEASRDDLESLHGSWMRSKEVERAIAHLQGKPWQDMGVEERIKFSVDKHYTEMAYYLYSRNYVELFGQDRDKADTCRKALEAKLAGTSGQLTGIEKWWNDVKMGVVKLPTLTTIPAGDQRAN